MSDIKLSRKIFDTLHKAVMLQQISEDKPLTKTVIIDDKEFVITGSASNHKEGYLCFSAHQAIPFDEYNGIEPPLYTNDHHIERFALKRKVGYHARIVLHNSRKLVMVDPMITFYPQDDQKAHL